MRHLTGNNITQLKRVSGVITSLEITIEHLPLNSDIRIYYEGQLRTAQEVLVNSAEVIHEDNTNEN